MDWSAHSTKVWRRNLGQLIRQCTQVLLALLTEGRQQRWCIHRVGARQGLEECEVAVLMCQVGNTRIEMPDGIEGCPQLTDQGFDHERVGCNDPGVGGQWLGLFDLPDAGLNDLGIAHVVSEVKNRSRVARRAFCAACRVGQRSRRSQKRVVSLSLNHCRT